MRLRGLLILSFLLSCFNVSASFFRNYQIEDGLSHNSVWAAMQDRKGFLWFGTADGLNRFDGKSFRIYRRKQGDPSSIGSNFIHCLKEDSRGRLLVGTKQGLYLFNESAESFKRIKLDEEYTSINSIIEDHNGNIWIACYGQGIYLLNKDLLVVKHFQSSSRKKNIPSNFIWTLLEDKSGTIWLGSEGKGLIRFDPITEKFISFTEKPESQITDPTVYSLHCDADNNLWIGTASSGLYRFNWRFGITSHYVHDSMPLLNLKAITGYYDHELIMGSDKGLVLFNTTLGTFRLINNSASFDNLSDKSIFCIFKDRENAFWIGTYFGGVNYFSPSINKFSYYPNIHPNSSTKNIISSFADNGDGQLWVATHDAGLALFNPKTGKFTNPARGLDYHDIQKLLLDGKKLYVSLYNKGIKVFDLKNNTVNNLTQTPPTANSNFASFANTIFKSSSGEIYFGRPEGAYIYDVAHGRVKTVSALSGMPVKDILEDYNGSLWFATHMHGLVRYSNNGKWTTVNYHGYGIDTILSNNINSVFHDLNNRLWVGTEGDGIRIINLTTGKYEMSFTEKQGLPSNIIYAIINDADGNIWASTSHGLARINPTTKIVRTFGYMEEVQNIRYNPNCAIRTSDNRLFFGGSNGFTSFNPRDLVSALPKPHLVLTGFQIANKDIAVGDELSPLMVSITNTQKLKLAHDQNNFSFDFIALSFISPAHNYYQYKLEGFEQNWNNIGSNNKAVYTNIPPGKYTFRVRAYNADGLWSDLQTELAITVERPFWFSNVMIAFYTILGIGIFVYLIYSYNKRVERLNKEKIYKYKVAKEKELYENKISFFTNIAHEIRTPLSLIVAPLDTIMASNDGQPQTKNNLKIIERNANRLLELVNQLLDFRKIEEDMFPFYKHKHNVMDVIRKVLNQYADTAMQKRITVDFISGKSDVFWVLDAEGVYKIVSNLMSNALKHARSHVQIKVKEIGNQLIISVKDDGIGIAEKNLIKVFEPFFQVNDGTKHIESGSGLGLSLSQLLAQKHGGELTVESYDQKGSKFILKLPQGVNMDELEEQTTIPSSIEANTVGNGQDSKLRVLIVEDNYDLRKFLTDNLGNFYKTFDAENGKIAIELLEQETIDLIISDIVMPEMTGMELCNRIKSDVAYSHIPVILLSAKTDTSSKIEGLQKGADVYIEKPFSIEQLIAQVNSIIENRTHIRDNFIKSPLQYFKQNTPNTENADFIVKLNNVILKHVSDMNFTIDNLSEIFSMSRSNFHKKIKNVTGLTPNDYIKLIRLNYSAQLLSSGKYKINEVCYLAGFNTPSYFTKCFSEQFGKLPKEFVQNVLN
ncbi:MAG: hybrid sensor histidine kinase/response regulator [Pedobacter sp.]|nr:MAG: hybrid sensor histidine kinase/response regulator [Pedobacter sp.]